MKLYRYKVEYENKGLKTRFFDTRRQMCGFVKKSGYKILNVYWKGILCYIRIILDYNILYIRLLLNSY